ncbi:MAG TPA: rod shape-determining protein MreC [Burkholderiaceae bacterium]|nr:rod shape-determining protein MreC [Burkholderiaceae bacterium]
MALGSFDRTPPPFFRQGPSALSRVLFFSALALLMMAADTRMKLAQPLRAVVATVLLPVERLLMIPVAAWQRGGEYLGGLQGALAREQAARGELVLQAERSARAEQLAQENSRLRGLLELRPALAVRSVAADVLYEAADPYSRKVVIDRGTTGGVVLGAPVINEQGVLGQVTRVYPLSAEVSLLTDKDAAIPVLNPRTQVRSVAYGLAGGAGLELRFMACNADVPVGDVLTTSGVDAIYPPGLPVAKVTQVDRRIETSFARIALQPVASPDSVRQVLVLEPIGVQLPPRPEPVAEASSAAPRKGTRRP